MDVGAQDVCGLGDIPADMLDNNHLALQRERAADGHSWTSPDLPKVNGLPSTSRLAFASAHARRHPQPDMPPQLDLEFHPNLPSGTPLQPTNLYHTEETSQFLASSSSRSRGQPAAPVSANDHQLRARRLGDGPDSQSNPDAVHKQFFSSASDGIGPDGHDPQSSMPPSHPWLTSPFKDITEEPSKWRRQQALNKAAQQRYRERKKAKILDLQQEVSSLRHQVLELDSLKCEKQALQERVATLERQLMVAEAQLAENAGPGGKADKGPVDMQQERDAVLSSLRDSVGQIREFFDQHGYGPQTAIGNLPPQHVQAIKRLVEATYVTCRQVNKMKLDTDIFRKIEAGIGQQQAWVETGSRWNQLQQQLQLSDNQVFQARQLRSQCLRQTSRLLSERQGLRMAVIKVILPSGNGGEACGAAEPLDFSTSFKRSDESYDQCNAITRLRENFEEEQNCLNR